MTHRTRAQAPTNGRQRRTTVKYRDERVTLVHEPWCEVAEHIDEVAVFGPDGGCSTPLEKVALSDGQAVTATLRADADGPRLFVEFPRDVVLTLADADAIAGLLSRLSGLGAAVTAPAALKASA